MADINLAQRAVKSTGWRWMPRMRAFDRSGQAFSIIAVHISGGILATLGEPGFSVIPMSYAALTHCLPDLDDPATKGCMLELARKRLRDPGLHMRGGRCGPKPWAVYGGDGLLVWRQLSPDHVAALEGSTEVEALIAALEASLKA